MHDKLTKIIATIGPSSDSEEKITQLIESGVNIFRFNFKHNTLEWHEERIKRVNTIAHKLKIPVGTLLDLQGPEIRISLPPDCTELEIKKGDLITITETAPKDDSKWFTITHMDVLSHLDIAQRLVADDGAFSFTVEEIGDRTVIRSHSDGIMGNRKSFNIPGADFPFPVLTDRDIDGIKLASRTGIDFVALSFVRSADDIRILKQELERAKYAPKVVSKIEAASALKKLKEIIAESDAVMVARGDLGVELTYEEVPFYQKIIIKESAEHGIPVITATQMLQSMVHSSYPTRAEISDVANAVYDLTDAVMLSGETAAGDYPVQTVSIMAQTVNFNENKFSIDNRTRFDFAIDDSSGLVCNAAYDLYLKTRDRAKSFAGFVVFTQSGRTAQLLSRYRPAHPIYTFTPHEHIRDGLTINYGVMPFMRPLPDNKEVTNEELRAAIAFLEKTHHIHKEDKIIVLHGDMWAAVGKTSTIRLFTV